MSKLITCKKCGEEFVLTPGKPGLITDCENCSEEVVEKLGGNMTWDHKTAPTLEIKPISEAKIFAQKQKRLGVGVTACLTQSKELDHKRLTKGNWT